MTTEIRIFPGSVGKDSLDFTLLLSEMYQEWAESKGYNVQVASHDWTYHPTSNPEGRGNALVVEVMDRDLVEELHGENGAHRLLRVSPHDPQKRRHTSFAIVQVLERSPTRERPLKPSLPEDLWEGMTRSYCFDPVHYMTDHRTGYKDKDPQGLLDGDLDRVLDHRKSPP